MKKFAVETIGCRLNQYETERIADQLTGLGLERVLFNATADLYIINTCTVTGRADASSRNIISRAARRKENPTVVVAGCYVNAEPDKVAHLNGVDLVVKNSEKENIGQILKSAFPGLFNARATAPPSKIIPEFFQHNRAWIKIGDGCNQRCAYCIIPLVRGELTNRPAAEIAEEIRLLARNGYHEVVLTGVHIGRYRHGEIESCAALVRHILDETDIPRIRLSSIEPQEVDGELIQVMLDGGRRICRHLHIPLQSGSDRILRLMRRPYNVEKYMKILAAAKIRLDGLIIGADIIVGFPGETDEDFKQSVLASDSEMIDYLHVFSYSDRPGTEASNMTDKIKPDVIKERNRILREISQKHYAGALKREIGKTVYAISEYGTDNTGKNYWAVTDNYLKIILPEGIGGGREILKLKAIGASEKYLVGELK